MSLFAATLITALVLLSLGLSLLSNSSIVSSSIKSFPRSLPATVVLFGSASALFLYRVWHLSAADMGEFRGLLFIFFSLVSLLSFIYVPDFLAVRGLAALTLLFAGPLLDTAYMHYELPQRLTLVSFVYLLILLALWLGAQPFRMRDFIEWLFSTSSRPRVVGACASAYGLVLLIVSFTY